MKVRIVLNYQTQCYEIASQAHLDERVERALKDMMNTGWDDLTFEGYMDGHHFVIEKVFDGIKYLNINEIGEMYYQAFQPECITIKE